MVNSSPRLDIATANILQLKKERQIKYIRVGLIIGLISGLLWGLDGSLLELWMSKQSWASSKTALSTAPLIGACFHDGFTSIWLFIINLASGKAKEILRSLRIKPGLIVCGAALLGGPIAMSGYLTRLSSFSKKFIKFEIAIPPYQYRAYV